ncbi:hypothetical protein HK405_015359, partial [Cladochytrium tenue]
PARRLTVPRLAHRSLLPIVAAELEVEAPTESGTVAVSEALTESANAPRPAAPVGAAKREAPPTEIAITPVPRSLTTGHLREMFAYFTGSAGLIDEKLRVTSSDAKADDKSSNEAAVDDGEKMETDNEPPGKTGLVATPVAGVLDEGDPKLIKSVRITQRGGSSGKRNVLALVAYIEFERAEDARAAAECMNGGWVDGVSVRVTLMTEEEKERERRREDAATVAVAGGRLAMATCGETWLLAAVVPSRTEARECSTGTDALRPPHTADLGLLPAAVPEAPTAVRRAEEAAAAEDGAKMTGGAGRGAGALQEGTCDGAQGQGWRAVAAGRPGAGVGADLLAGAAKKAGAL